MLPERTVQGDFPFEACILNPAYLPALEASFRDLQSLLNLCLHYVPNDEQRLRADIHAALSIRTDKAMNDPNEPTAPPQTLDQEPTHQGVVPPPKIEAGESEKYNKEHDAKGAED